MRSIKTREANTMQRTLTVLFVAFVLVAASCGSGGGTSAPTENSGLAAGFVAEETSPSAGTVSAAESDPTNDFVTVQINVTGTTGIHGVAFDLNYDANQADWVGYSEGTLLEQGASVSYVVSEPVPGQIVISANRQGGGPGADANGTVEVIALTFRIDEQGASQVSFDSNWVLDDSVQPAPMPGIDWYGGALTGI